MGQHIGLDVSLKETAISVRQDGKRTWRGKGPSDPKLLADVIRKRAPNVKRVVFDTGPLSVWFYHALTAEGLPAICIDARHVKAALDRHPTKPMRTMQTVSPAVEKSVFTVKCGSSSMTASLGGRSRPTYQGRN
jgi:transposase